MVNWMKYRLIYLLISGSLIVVGILGIFEWGMRLGLDFAGGTIIEYKFENEISGDDLSQKLDSGGFKASSIQKVDEKQYLLRLPPIDADQKAKYDSLIETLFKQGEFEVLRFETAGPSIGPELVKKTIYAIIIASVAILVWVAFQFRSLKFGTSAVLAMFHDTFILIGLFSLLGHFFNAEVDFLFVTAVLTTLSFSVHDTIVVYDRIRESQKKFGGSLSSIADKAITETMVRSLNNSFTIAFMLVALVLLGGTTIKWFAVALLIGTVLGTYSSPFVAVPMLVTWDEVAKRIRK